MTPVGQILSPIFWAHKPAGSIEQFGFTGGVGALAAVDPLNGEGGTSGATHAVCACAPAARLNTVRNGSQETFVVITLNRIRLSQGLASRTPNSVAYIYSPLRRRTIRILDEDGGLLDALSAPQGRPHRREPALRPIG
jgi:hypothetical protein